MHLRSGHRRRLQLQPLEPRRLLAGPSGLEQEFLQRVNRFRTDPQGEYGRMIAQTSPLVARDAAVQDNLDFFQVSGPTLRSQWNLLTPVPPLAWNADLQDAASGHTALMVATNTQSHQIGGEPSLGDRLRNAGYSFRAAAENVFAYCESIDFCHAGLAIDWGNGPDGIQSPPGHRDNLLSPSFQEIGIAVQQSTTSGPGLVGPLVATQDFATRQGLSTRVVGAVFEDQNGSDWYDAGEGKGGVTVSFTATSGTGSTVSTTTMTAGGYQIDLTPGTYEATFHSGAIDVVRGGVVVGEDNLWLNLETTQSPSPPPQVSGDFVSVVEGESSLLDVLANDVAAAGGLNGASLRLEQSTTAAGEWENVGGEIRFTPNPGVNGFFENRYRVADQAGTVSGWASVRVMVLQAAGPLWQNRLDPADVDGDGQVLPVDALRIINELNRRGIGAPLPPQPDGSGPTSYVDVDGDGSVFPIDALAVINALNQRSGDGEGEGETEFVVEQIDPQAFAALRKKRHLSPFAPRK